MSGVTWLCDGGITVRIPASVEDYLAIDERTAEGSMGPIGRRYVGSARSLQLELLASERDLRKILRDLTEIARGEFFDDAGPPVRRAAKKGADAITAALREQHARGEHGA